MIINLLVWLAFGALAGWIAGKLMDSEKGLAANIVIGCIGSIVGGLLPGCWASGRRASASARCWSPWAVPAC
ncbi:MAG: GlsB/YeaQ/YmgE family stress response membrane protein [Christensenellales bacterium]|jgi:uncharacterized membrane protein YeaQ/YmgE (transglycosylase-associated protein family)